ncbi:MAG: hypothetical protein KAY24_11640 [Candidatus Eisenbacteria sp.]|nr:hypothetical protein [Candidatus Eisenbacteria bacterium]
MNTHLPHYQITSCHDQNTTVQTSSACCVSWYLVAAFEEDKEWSGVQFGFSDYDPNIFMFERARACFPPNSASIQYTTGGWPGPLSGVTLSTVVPWEGNWLAVFAFRTYVYGYNGSGLAQLIPDPTAAVPFGGFRNSASPPEKGDAALGGLGVNQPGT